jgi:hypothetical protein
MLEHSEHVGGTVDVMRSDAIPKPVFSGSSRRGYLRLLLCSCSLRGTSSSAATRSMPAQRLPEPDVGRCGEGRSGSFEISPDDSRLLEGTPRLRRGGGGRANVRSPAPRFTGHLGGTQWDRRTLFRRIPHDRFAQILNKSRAGLIESFRTARSGGGDFVKATLIVQGDQCS